MKRRAKKTEDVLSAWCESAEAARRATFAFTLPVIVEQR
jgi:hypothetical protein